MTRGKRVHTVAARVDDPVLAEIDRYQRDRERETRVPLTRGLVMLEILERWARERREERDARGR